MYMHTYTSDIDVTPLQTFEILAAGMNILVICMYVPNPFDANFSLAISEPRDFCFASLLEYSLNFCFISELQPKCRALFSYYLFYI